MMNPESASGSGDTLEPIRRVKAIESDTEAKLAEWAQQAKAQLETLARESEARVAQARAEAERARDLLLETSRTESQVEAERILADGRANAAKIRAKTASDLAPQRDVLLDTILGELRGRGKKTGA